MTSLVFILSHGKFPSVTFTNMRGCLPCPYVPLSVCTSLKASALCQVASADPVTRLCPGLDHLIPESPNDPYDMHAVVQAIVDDGEWFEIHPDWAKNILVRLKRRCIVRAWLSSCMCCQYCWLLPVRKTQYPYLCEWRRYCCCCLQVRVPLEPRHHACCDALSR